jgi:hypothetical protein
MNTINVNSDAASTRVRPSKALLSVLAALNEGKFSKAVDQFDDHFKVTDHGLGLSLLTRDA